MDREVVIVTGAAGGIGQELIRALLERDACIVAHDTFRSLDGRKSDAERRDAMLAAEPRENLHWSSGAESIEELFSECENRFGSISGIVHLAGIDCPANIARVTADDLARLQEIYVTMPWQIVQSAANAQKAINIVLSTNAGDIQGVAKRCAHAMFSSAVIGLCKSAALELRKWDIRINAISPMAKTRATANNPIIERARAGRYLAADVAKLYAHLVSPASAPHSGNILHFTGSDLSRIDFVRGHNLELAEEELADLLNRLA